MMPFSAIAERIKTRSDILPLICGLKSNMLQKCLRTSGPSPKTNLTHSVYSRNTGTQPPLDVSDFDMSRSGKSQKKAMPRILISKILARKQIRRVASSHSHPAYTVAHHIETFITIIETHLFYIHHCHQQRANHLALPQTLPFYHEFNSIVLVHLDLWSRVSATCAEPPQQRFIPSNMFLLLRSSVHAADKIAYNLSHKQPIVSPIA